MLEFDLSFPWLLMSLFFFTLTNEFFSCKVIFFLSLEMVEKSPFYRDFSPS
ncbi:hypothetical protein KSS87_003551 [Heliosperma pusillum]|nr:hypothetical protein KSS87_003551 [Heliosperma pusillum]